MATPLGHTLSRLEGVHRRQRNENFPGEFFVPGCKNLQRGTYRKIFIQPFLVPVRQMGFPGVNLHDVICVCVIICVRPVA